jgi:hypothetical protein
MKKAFLFLARFLALQSVVCSMGRGAAGVVPCDLQALPGVPGVASGTPGRPESSPC